MICVADTRRAAAAPLVTVLVGKGGKRRTIGLDPGAFAIVQRWLDVRSKLRRGTARRANAVKWPQYSR